MKVVAKGTKQVFTINLEKLRGEESILCPACSSTRKKKTDKCFGWNHEKRTGQCFNCQEAFYEHRDTKALDKTYDRPQWQNNTELTNDAVRFFEGRKISQFTLRQMKVSCGFDWMPKHEKEVDSIHFNYFRGEELINIKYRAKNKSFKLHKDAELIFYNLNGIGCNESAIIVEGEMDCLSYFEVGFKNCVSVPNGATNFDFIDQCYDDIERIEKWYIAVDNDEPGIKLRNELVRRIGAEKCWLVDFKDCKDANEYFIKYGKDALVETINDAKDIPLDGIFTVSMEWDKMIYEFRNGKRYGTTTHFSNLDKHWKWRQGEVTLITGYTNDGKSCFWNALQVMKAEMEGWRFAMFCPENYPVSELIDELIHCYIGKSTDKRFANVMTEDEYISGANFINDHFFFVLPDDNYQLDTVLNRFKYLIRRHGVNCCSIDPYNQIEHQMERGEREDLYISKFMSKLKKFSIDNDVCIGLVAHQVTPMFMGKEDYPQPDIYKIKGGGTFADKCDNVMSVWRPYRKSNYENPTVKIIVGKVKKQRLVGIPGETEFAYDVTQNRYKNGDEKYPRFSYSEPKDIYEENIYQNADQVPF